MRFLANENVPRDAVECLRRAGHDVTWVRTDAPGSTDEAVLNWAVREMRILLTFDKDFGELAAQADLLDECGVVLLRLPMPTPQKAGEAIARIVGGRDDWHGHFSVIEPGRVRLRPLPKR
jgi:predicted nuclease of predicted toxin-antitoxin system